jgi:metal-responsive CopG/Arc/MetJ family transcriptional regulator
VKVKATRKNKFKALIQIDEVLWAAFQDVVDRLKGAGLMNTSATRSSIIKNYVRGFIVDMEGELRRYEVANGSVIKAFQELETELEDKSLEIED